jgi:hypothetical protein
MAAVELELIFATSAVTEGAVSTGDEQQMTAYPRSQCTAKRNSI